MGNSKKRILYIDPILQPGHVNFNEIFIKSFLKSGFEIDFVFVDGYEKQLNLSRCNSIYRIPFFLASNKFGGFGNRICYTIILLLIRLNCKFKKYDFVVFSSFEEISFFASGISDALLINHINAGNASGSSLKFYFLDKILKKNKLIVLDLETKRYLESVGKYDIIMKPHGLNQAKTETLIENVDVEIFSKVCSFSKIIFAPSDGSSDKAFLKGLIADHNFLEFLERNDILFILKNNDKSGCKNILEIDRYLDVDTYNYIFTSAYAILAAYPNSFKFRVSGVLLEAMSNNKPCVLSEIPALENYTVYFNYDPFFNDNESILIKLNNLLNVEASFNFYRNTHLLQPDFNDFYKS